eukprot:176149-Prymnesium_polylepis.1
MKRHLLRDNGLRVHRVLETSAERQAGSFVWIAAGPNRSRSILLPRQGVKCRNSAIEGFHEDLCAKSTPCHPTSCLKPQERVCEAKQRMRPISFHHSPSSQRLADPMCPGLVWLIDLPGGSILRPSGSISGGWIDPRPVGLMDIAHLRLCEPR